MTETYHGFIDTAQDALIIFEACNKGMLNRVQRRFSDRERRTIRSGAVYVWDEEETTMRRWTDGRTWSPSRVHGCFLIYYELEGRRHQFVNRGNGGPSSGRGGSGVSPHNGQIEPAPFSSSHELCPPNIVQKEHGLIKKALSLCTNDKRKLHLVCYYSREDVESGCLTSPKNDPRFANLQVYEDMYPEIGHGSGRSDRYGGGRARTAATTTATAAVAAVRQWNPASPDSPALRESQPAYVRSSMASERRARANRAEVHRYPSYGPYAGPVRHIPLTTQTLHPQSQQQQQQQPVHSFSPANNMQTASPPRQQQQPSPDTLLYTQGTSAVPYGHSTPANMASPGQFGQGATTTGFQTPAPTPYTHHPHSYTPGAWMPGPLPNQQQLRPAPSSSSSYVASHASPAFFPSAPQSTHQPVWQHSEPPKSYASNSRPGTTVQSTASLPSGAWGVSTSGLMIQMGNDPAPPASCKRVQEYESSPPNDIGQGPHLQAPSQQQTPANRHPSTERLDVLMGGTMACKRQQLPAVTARVGDNASSSRMNSEDMRQLASLRISLH
ncbi:Gluconate transport-inducing protein [Coemansia aciculifera]|uniref:Gluconate transport-inducing protein n=1 Tax=Coemansia aciculifera TaxID=417176 RepID=A0ACC1MB63_9FUNG|nr:Gluconate transport-inducing protein [Coemansia aciculifera]